MNVGDLIRPKRDPRCYAIVLDMSMLHADRIRVLVLGYHKPEQTDPRMWEVISEATL